MVRPVVPIPPIESLSDVMTRLMARRKRREGLYQRTKMLLGQSREFASWGGNSIIDIAKHLYDRLWWKACPGTIITTKWPVGRIYSLNGLCYKDSTDPNDHYRPELEEHVGKQGIDWDWQVGPYADNSLLIKIRSGKTKWATYFAVKWS